MNRRNIPDLGFEVEVIQRHENGNVVYGGYGLRVLEIAGEEGKCAYQLRVRDNLTMDWLLQGTYRKPEEVRTQLRRLKNAA